MNVLSDTSCLYFYSYKDYYVSFIVIRRGILEIYCRHNIVIYRDIEKCREIERYREICRDIERYGEVQKETREGYTSCLQKKMKEEERRRDSI